jgi:ABC-type transport system involved in cytochrome c biogenesis ATPase subunit
MHVFLFFLQSESGVIVHDVKRLKRHATHEIVEHVLAESRQYSGQEEDVELVLLRRVRDRLGAVGLEPPTITVRFRELTVMSKVSVSSRQLPTISAPVMTKLAPMLRALGSSRAAPRRPFTLLDAASGVLHPGRLTLLLGPPQSGKTTLLRTLAGLTRRVSALKVAAEELTYNGYALGEFVPERSLAYVSQIDTHFGELTVRETLEFSARVQSTGHRRALVEEVEAREQTAGITADPALAAYMRSMAMGGRRSVIAELVLRLLGLTEAADTVVRL